MKQQKRIKPTHAALVTKKEQTSVKTVKQVANKAKSKPVTVSAASVTLTSKQQQVLDIVRGKVDGANTKSIGLEAGQEDAKAASWATGALKKLVEENLVDKVQLDGNKVIYKAI